MAKESKLVEQHDTITQLLSEGLSGNKIAETLNLPSSTVSDYIRKYVVPKFEGSPDGLSSDAGHKYTEIPVFTREYDEIEHYVYPLGDLHKGAEAHAKDRWREWVTYLESRKAASLLFTGDGLNAALKTSVSETYDETMTVGAAKRELRKELETLGKEDRIDILMRGNHENRIYKAVGDCPIQDIADSFDAPYASDAAVIIYKVGDQTYTFYVRHGTGGGQVGARANRLAKQAQTLQADVYVSGHTHSQLVFPQEVFYVDTENEQVERRTQYFVSSGSFLGYEKYASSAGYSPTKIGAPRIRLDGRRHDVHVSV